MAREQLRLKRRLREAPARRQESYGGGRYTLIYYCSFKLPDVCHPFHCYTILMLGVQSFTHASIATTRKDTSQGVSEASFDSACRCDRHNFIVQNQS